MADEIEQQQEEKQDNYSSTVLLEPDWFLRTIASLVDRQGMEIGITLSVGGILVTGIMVGGRKYFEHFAKKFASGFSDPDLSASLEKSISQYTQIYDNAPEDVEATPTFVHIRDVAFYASSATPIPSQKGHWWRGRLTKVDGFVLGTLSTN
jgi:hypothetical protein